jgi:prevent-host-death family protein
MTHMESRVGVRELRQNLSRYLERVKAGESLIVTERGTEVARLTPSGANRSALARLIAERGATIPQGDLIAALGPRHRIEGPSAAAVLAEQREERL